MARQIRHNVEGGWYFRRKAAAEGSAVRPERHERQGVLSEISEERETG